MSGGIVGKRVLHFVRHAQSEFNTFANHQIEGFFAGMTSLDAKLTPHGIKQCEKLKLKIENESNNNPMSIKNAKLIVTSPLSRAIRTAQLSMPMSKYQYVVRAEVTEQIENISDIGYSKLDLMEMYPELKDSINQLPHVWWWQHPHRWNKNNNNNNNHINGANKANGANGMNGANGTNNINGINNINDNTKFGNVIKTMNGSSSTNNNNNEVCPRTDANMLAEYNGTLPAAESKYMVRKRCQYFLKWLYSHNNNNNNNNNNENNTGSISPLFINNIAIFSHSCTMKEFEIILSTLGNEHTSDDEDNESQIGFRKNTEVVSYQLPLNENEIDWQLLQNTVDQARGTLNHADKMEINNNNNNDIDTTDTTSSETCISYGHEDIYGNDPLSEHLDSQFNNNVLNLPLSFINCNSLVLPPSARAIAARMATV